jgi:hypothetical protein
MREKPPSQIPSPDEQRAKTFHDHLYALQGMDVDPYANSAGTKNWAKSVGDYLPYLAAYNRSGGGEFNEKYYMGVEDGAMHKLHLNVAPEHSAYVASYLQQSECRHKFLSGGEPGVGAIFTVYTGSKAWTDKVADMLSRHLKDRLCRPVAGDEVEYAPNVSGRFTHGPAFLPYGIGGMRGITPLEEDADMLWGLRSAEPEEKLRTVRLLFERSFARAARTYGKYFHG